MAKVRSYCVKEHVGKLILEVAIIWDHPKFYKDNGCQGGKQRKYLKWVSQRENPIKATKLIPQIVKLYSQKQKKGVIY